MNSKKITGSDADSNKNRARKKSWGFSLGSLFLAVLALLLSGSFTKASANATNNTAPPFLQAPPVGLDTSAGFLLVIQSGGSLRFKSDPTQGPFDGSEDTLVAVQNNSAKSISAIPLNGFQTIFGFEGDGLCANSITPHPAGCPFGPTGYEGPGTSFSNLSSDRRSGIVHFNPPIPPKGSAYFSLEDKLVSSCPGLTPPTHLRQGDTNWASTKLGHSQATIGAYGCYITSSAMLINFFANKHSVAFQTDPAKLNAWLTSSNGFDASGNVIVGGEALIAKYARDNGVTLHYTGMVDHRDDFTLDQYLCNGQPPVIYVGNPHWVFTTGQTNVNGTDTYSVLDPDSYPNGGTLLGGFNDTYGAIDTYSDSSGSLSGLYLVAHSPVELVLTAPGGGQKGINPTTGARLDSIPASGYKEFTIGNDVNHAGKSLPKIKRLNVVAPADGAYLLTIFGTGNGAYTIDIAADDANGKRVKKSLTGIATIGSKVCYNVVYQSSPVSQSTNSQNSIITITPTTCATSGSVTIDDLINAVKVAGQTRHMNPKVSVRLLRFLRDAKLALAQGNTDNATNSLNAFIQAVHAYSGNRFLIPADLVGSLIDDAQSLMR